MYFFPLNPNELPGHTLTPASLNKMREKASPSKLVEEIFKKK
jgi:hypothetical protein